MMHSKTIFLCLAIFLGIGLVPFTSVSQETSDADHLATINRMYEKYRHDFPGINEVSPAVLMEWLETGDVVIVDIRKKSERKISVLPHSITKRELDAVIEDHKGSPIVLYCTIGYRSGKLARSLQKQGVDVYNLQGGILAWVHAGGFVVRDDEPTHQVHVYGNKWNLLPESFEAVW